MYMPVNKVTRSTDFRLWFEKYKNRRTSPTQDSSQNSVAPFQFL